MVNYCPYCGIPVVIKVIENRPRAVCEKCGWIHYEHRKLSAGARVIKDGKILLVQRGIEPWKGCWHLPSGYMEFDEEPQTAAEREVKEETGFCIKTGNLVDVYTYCDDPRGNGIVLIYDAQLLDGHFMINDETTNARFFSPKDIMQLPLAGMTARQSLQDWIASQSGEKGNL